MYFLWVKHILARPQDILQKHLSNNHSKKAFKYITIVVFFQIKAIFLQSDQPWKRIFVLGGAKQKSVKKCLAVILATSTVSKKPQEKQAKKSLLFLSKHQENIQ